MQLLEVSAGSGGKAAAISESDFVAAFQGGIKITARYLRSVGANRDMAEEVAQGAWTRAWQYRAQLADPRAILPWVNTIARNLYWAALTSQKRLLQIEEHPSASMPWHKLEIDRLIKSCSPFESRLLQLFYYLGFSTFEIAQREGINPTTVRVRLMRLRVSLRLRMGGTADVCAPAA